MEIVVDLFNQHSGDVEDLKRLSLSAWMNGADVVKIQLFKSEVVWGDDSRRYMEMTFDQVKSLKDYCDNLGITFAATPFDKEKVDWLEDLGVEFHKVASVSALKHPDLVEYILSKNKKTFISLGKYETNEFPYGFDKNINYLYCSSKYPTLLNDKKILDMPTFSDKGYMGYSDHTLGISAGIKSYFLGAKMLEKHYTFDQSSQRNCELAHLCSFTPETLRTFTNLVKNFKIMEK
jgi:sialic acid synthase SpsE